jgi:glutathione S-transferase
MTELYLFPHSHYCEAARWALDLKGVAYRATPIMPGPHLILIPRIAPKSSLPVLLMDDDVVQGAREIMDYLDVRFPGNQLAPKGAEARAMAAQLEADADANIGVPLRAAIYQHLIHHKASMKHCFTYGMPAHKKLFFSLTYPILKKRIHDTYVRDDAYIAQAKAQLADQIARFDKRVEGRTFLVGDRLSRADIMVASMLSIGVLPEEHPFDWPELGDDPELLEVFDQFQASATFAWVRRIYRDHRNGGIMAQAAQ